MGGAILADTEGVVGENVFGGELLEGGHTDGGLHVVGEDEEGAAGGAEALVEDDAVDDAGHGELGHAGLEEGAGEVTDGQGVGLLEEAVGLVGVAEVGGGDDHVADVLCEVAEHGG